jgi:signal transduction histidine kinase
MTSQEATLETGRVRPHGYEIVPAIFALGLVAIACGIVVQSFAAAQRLAAQRDAAGASFENVWRFLLSLNENDIAFRLFVLTGDPAARDAWEQGQVRVRAAWESVKAVLAPAVGADGIRELEGVIAEKRQASEAVMALRARPDFVAASAVAELNIRKLAVERVRTVLQQIAAAQRSKFVLAGREIRHSVLRALEVGMAGLGLLLGIMLWEYLRLRASAARIRTLRAGILEAEDRYRRLSAKHEEQRELTAAATAHAVHDGLGQALVAIKLDAESAARILESESGLALPVLARLGPVLTRIRTTAYTTASTARDIAMELRPAILDLCGIGTALEWLAGEVRARTSLQITVRATASDQLALTAEEQTGMFRIAQEALANTVQHSRAKRVSVTLGREPGAVAMTIDDDGVGIRAAEFHSAHALGLLGMQERAEMLGASLEITNIPGGGARIKLSMPQRATAGSVS